MPRLHFGHTNISILCGSVKDEAWTKCDRFEQMNLNLNGSGLPIETLHY